VRVTGGRETESLLKSIDDDDDTYVLISFVITSQLVSKQEETEDTSLVNAKRFFVFVFFSVSKKQRDPLIRRTTRTDERSMMTAAV
jgi:nitrogen regulatory protein PII-like uncharacterized protein